MRGLSAAAIMLGGVVDVFLSSVLDMLLVFEVFYSRGLGTVSKERLLGAITSLMHSDARLYAAQAAIGLGTAVIGGFVAASIARERRVVNGVLACWLSVGIGLVSMIRGTETAALVVQAALIAVTVLCYRAGATIRLRLSRPALASLNRRQRSNRAIENSSSSTGAPRN